MFIVVVCLFVLVLLSLLRKKSLKQQIAYIHRLGQTGPNLPWSHHSKKQTWYPLHILLGLEHDVYCKDGPKR